MESLSLQRSRFAFRAVIGIALGLAALTQAAFAQGYRIDNWDEKINLTSDANFSVEEAIQVTFTDTRHGIFREIPTAYDDGRGKTRAIYLRDISVTDENGTPYTTKESSSGGDLNIRIGDADVTFPPGTKKTYIIRYTVSNAINWFNDESWEPSAELYWNVNGEGWQSGIAHMKVTVDFPDAGDAKDVRARIFAGAYGSRDSHTVTGATKNDVDHVTRTTVSLSANELQISRDFLPPYSGLTFVLDVPAKLIKQPGPLEQFLVLLRSNLGFGIPLVMILLAWFAWARFGKDPDGGPMVVQFEPPDGLSGAATGAFLQERVDQRDLASGIIGLAVKGYLKIHPKEVGFVLKHRTADLEIVKSEPGPELGIFEAALLKRLALGGPMVTDADMSTYVASNISQLKAKIFEELVDKGYYTDSPINARGNWVGISLGACFLMGAAAYLLSPTLSMTPSLVGGVIGFIIALAVSPLMSRRTPLGARTLSKVKGFEDFIRRAKGNQIEWKAKKNPDQLLFESYLPYAIAFGLAAEWAAAFEGVAMTPPSWYVSPYGMPYNPMMFAYDLTGIGNTLGTSAFTPPRSSGASGGFSGFGGGGFSGGGFGGGGGGSW